MEKRQGSLNFRIG